MVREPNPERAQRMFERILNDLDAKPEPKPWLDAARTLSERLVISEDTFFYIADLLTQCIMFAASSTDPQLMSASDAMIDIERAHGLHEDETWTTDEATEEWRRLSADWNRRANEIVNAGLRVAGHADVAAFREGNRDALLGRLAKGRRDLWGEDDEEGDDWLGPAV
jgi:hypothetical protein